LELCLVKGDEATSPRTVTRQTSLVWVVNGACRNRAARSGWGDSAEHSEGANLWAFETES